MSYHVVIGKSFLVKEFAVLNSEFAVVIDSDLDFVLNLLLVLLSLPSRTRFQTPLHFLRLSGTTILLVKSV